MGLKKARAQEINSGLKISKIKILIVLQGKHSCTCGSGNTAEGI